jgi:hypothetical protein
VEPAACVRVFENADGDWWAECLVCEACGVSVERNTA